MTKVKMINNISKLQQIKIKQLYLLVKRLLDLFNSYAGCFQSERSCQRKRARTWSSSSTVMLMWESIGSTSSMTNWAISP